MKKNSKYGKSRIPTPFGKKPRSLNQTASTESQKLAETSKTYTTNNEKDISPKLDHNEEEFLETETQVVAITLSPDQISESSDGENHKTPPPRKLKKIKRQKKRREILIKVRPPVQSYDHDGGSEIGSRADSLYFSTLGSLESEGNDDKNETSCWRKAFCHHIWCIPALAIIGIVALLVIFYHTDIFAGSATEAVQTTEEVCRVNEIFLGDGLCEDHANIAACTYDGGDCCLERVVKAICQECLCKTKAMTTTNNYFLLVSEAKTTTTTTTAAASTISKTTTTISAISSISSSTAITTKTTATTTTTTTTTTDAATAMSCSITNPATDMHPGTRLLAVAGYNRMDWTYNMGSFDMSRIQRPELFDVTNCMYHSSRESCPELRCFHRQIYGSVGFWLTSLTNGQDQEDGVIVVCGGYDFTPTTDYHFMSDRCFYYNLLDLSGSGHCPPYYAEGHPDHQGYIQLKEPRRFSAGITLDDNRIWITGGEYLPPSYTLTTVRSTEILSLNGSVWSVDLPHEMLEHCIVKINQNEALLIGGQGPHWLGTLRSTWHVDLSDFSFKQKSGMNEPRARAACGSIQANPLSGGSVSGDSDDDDDGDGVKAIVAAGGCSYSCYASNTNAYHLSSSELWIIDGQENWIFGPELPAQIFGASGVSSPDQSSFFVVGGETLADLATETFEALTSIYRLTCNSLEIDSLDCSWQNFGPMKEKRSGSVVLIIPNDLDPC